MMKMKTESLMKLQLVCVLAMLFAALIAVVHSAQQEEEEDEPTSCHMREWELCAVGSLAFIRNQNGLPVTEQEMIRTCAVQEEALDCIEKFSERCLTKEQNYLRELMFGNGCRWARRLCANGTELRSRYLRHASCFRGVQVKYQRPCLLDLQAAAEPWHKIDVSLRLPLACCNTNRFRECILPRVEDECGRDAIEFVDEFIANTMGTVPNVVCRKYEPSSSQCKRLMPPMGAPVHNGLNTSAISRLVSTFNNVYHPMKL